MKSYTDIEQSKKLAEILPLESADMCYRIVAYNPNNTHEYQPYCFSSTLESDIPCWSLAALLDALPKNLDIGRPVLATNYRGYYWVEYFDECMKETNLTLKTHNNPIDACYEMILKLNELNLL